MVRPVSLEEASSCPVHWTESSNGSRNCQNLGSTALTLYDVEAIP